MREAHETNRRSWNAATAAHNSHKKDQAAFLRDGGSTLFPEEIELLGSLSGKRVLHLQCNCGQDTLSLVHRGADVTGVDISDEAISFARRLSDESGLSAEFHRGEVCDWLREAALRGERWDVVFCSYGALGWLPDLPAWSRAVASVLTDSGRLVLIEFHPLVWSIGEDGGFADDYFVTEPIHEKEGVPDYVGASGDAISPSGFENGTADFVNPEPCVSFQWTTGSLFDALMQAGLTVEVLREYPYANACALWTTAEPIGDRRFGTPPGVPKLPLMLGVCARK